MPQKSPPRSRARRLAPRHAPFFLACGPRAAANPPPKKKKKPPTGFIQRFPKRLERQQDAAA
jgi:hypothetical protein